MPPMIGGLELPKICPHFLTLRVAIRPHLQDHVHIGLSGGPDSLALVAAARAEGAAVTALCINHNLQQASAAVSEEAARQAELMGAVAVIRSIQVPPGNGMEAAAREARYAEFAQLTSTIWTGHTMDDQAETFLLAGLRGNPAGMKETSRRPDLRIVRPLLGVRRANTHGACAELALSPWSDPQNFDHAFRRVAIRERAIPLLAEIHEGDPVPGLALAASRAARNEEVLEGVVDKQRGQWAEGFPVALASEPPALRHHMLADFLRGHGVRVTSKKLEAIDRLLTHWHGQGGVAVGKTATGRLEVVRVSGKLRVTG